MNRKERRKLHKDGVAPISIMQKYRDEAVNYGYQKGVYYTSKTTLLLSAYIAMMEFDLDQDGLAKYMERLLNCIDSFRTGQLTTDDVDAIIEEVKEHGFDIGKFYQ